VLGWTWYTMDNGGWIYPEFQSFQRGVQQNHEDSGSLIMLAHSAITQMHKRYGVGASTWLIILPKHLACMWCSAFGDLTNLHYHGKAYIR
jgi:hypothetical protein